VPGTLVCRRHGGAAPQVLIKARHVELQMALHNAAQELKVYEAKLATLSELRAELRQRKTPPNPE
jgi:hypothetical protein